MKMATTHESLDDADLMTLTVYELESTLTNLTATEAYLSRLDWTNPVKRLADLCKESPPPPDNGL